MAQVTAPFTWYPNGYPGPGYDLSKVVHFAIDPDDSTKVHVRFRNQELSSVVFDKVAFYTAMGL